MWEMGKKRRKREKKGGKWRKREKKGERITVRIR